MKLNTIDSSRTLPRFSRLAILVVGLVACATPSRNAESRPLHASEAGYQVQVLVDGAPAPTFWHDGETYVMGHAGERYVIRVLNHTGHRIEAVATVDGRDAVDGKPGDFRHKRGYVVPAWGQVDIDGWRLSESQAATFRFSSVADSYAARMGNAREVGVIGVAVFSERVHRPRPLPVTPPCCFDGYRDVEQSYRDAPAGSARAAPRLLPARPWHVAMPWPSAISEAAPMRPRARQPRPSTLPAAVSVRDSAPSLAKLFRLKFRRSNSSAQTPPRPLLSWACATTITMACSPWA
jgi:hypothetical protein